MNLISVIVTTYNWPAALELCLDSLFAQHDPAFEIIIADDGSTPANQALATAHCAKSPVPIRYVHHDDQGFRAGTIRNKAVADSQGEYLLFVDGDCVCPAKFIARHRQLAESGRFVPGNRVLLSEQFTQEVIEKHIPLHRKPLCYFMSLRLQKKNQPDFRVYSATSGLFKKIAAQQVAKSHDLQFGAMEKRLLAGEWF